MARCGVELILILFGLFMTLGIIATYVIAVTKGHVNPALPYISNTGSNPPESCLFTFVLSCVAIIVFMIMWIRYRHIKCHYSSSPAKVQLLNGVSFFFGFLSMFGLILVGSFQDVNVIIIHITGAFMVFICGAVYSVLQTVLSFKVRRMHPNHVGLCTLTFRLIFSLMLCLSVFLTIVFSSVASNCRSITDQLLYAGPVDSCSILHTVGAASEWLLAIMMILYFLTFHPDFSRISVELHIKLRHHHSDVNGTFINEDTPLVF